MILINVVIDAVLGNSGCMRLADEMINGLLPGASLPVLLPGLSRGRGAVAPKMRDITPRKAIDDSLRAASEKPAASFCLWDWPDEDHGEGGG